MQPQPGAVIFDGEEFRVDATLLRQGRPWNPALKWGVVIGLTALIVLGGLVGTVLRSVLWVIAAVVAVAAGITLLIAVFGKRLSAWGAGMIIPRMMKTVDKKYSKVRQELLKSMKGRVLDVGAGGGAYLQYAFANEAVTEVVALEPNVGCHAHIKTTVSELCEGKGYGKGLAPRAAPPPSVEIVSEFIEDHLKRVGGERYDWAILGNVLCEVPDPQSVLRALDALMKPGARVYFSEHVRAPPGTMAETIQDWVNPWWVRVSDGCNCNRDSVGAMRRGTGWALKVWTFQEKGLPWIPIFELGIGVKSK